MSDTPLPTGGSSFDLLKCKDTTRPISFSDGLAAYLISQPYPAPDVFVTSPNQMFIPQTSVSKSPIDLKRRADARYGFDDPIQHPQPFNSDHCYLAAVPRRPISDLHPYYDEKFMWFPPSEQEQHFIKSNVNSSPPVGEMASFFMNEITAAVRRAQNRLDEFISRLQESTKHPHSADNARIFHNIMDFCLLGLQSPSTWRDACRGLCELQRAWIYSVALIDYIDKYVPRYQSQSPPPAVADVRIGSFTSDPRTAQVLFKMGLPVYLLRDITMFGRTNILQIVRPEPCRIVTQDAVPPYPIAFTGSPGSRGHFLAIERQSFHTFRFVNHFSRLRRSPEPPTQSSSSASARLMTGGPQRTPTRAAKHHPYRSPTANGSAPHGTAPIIFHPLPSTKYTPFAPPTWTEAALRIDKYHPEYKLGADPPPRNYIVPPAHLFFTADDVKVPFLHIWHHLRGPWLQRCRENPLCSEGVNGKVWRGVLDLSRPTAELWEVGRVPNTSRQVIHKDASDLWRETMSRYSTDSLLHNDCSCAEAWSVKDIRERIWELTEICFGFDLMTLDGYADTQQPQESSNTRESDMLLYKSRRQSLLSEVLCGRSLFSGVAGDGHTGLAAVNQQAYRSALRCLYRVTSTWEGTKPLGWHISDEEGLDYSSNRWKDWEKAVIRFYLQTGYNHLGYAPCLPHGI